MHYYLLEDTLIQQKRIRNIIDTCRIFDNPTAFLAALMADEQPKTILLDLEIKTVSEAGFNVAKAIRRVDTLSPIIVVTTHSEMVATSYEYHIGAIDFIDKSLPEQQFVQRIESALQDAAKQYFNNNHETKQLEMVLLPTGENISLEDMIYIAHNGANSHLLTIYCSQQTIQIRGTVKTLAEIHPKLIRIHAAYIINRDMIESLDTKAHTVTLKHQVTLPCSRKYLKMLKVLLAI